MHALKQIEEAYTDASNEKKIKMSHPKDRANGLMHVVELGQSRNRVTMSVPELISSDRGAVTLRVSLGDNLPLA